MVNEAYRYPGYELWDDAQWIGRDCSPMCPLVDWFGAHCRADRTPYPHPIDGLYGEALRTQPSYIKKTNSVAPPAETAEWAARGMGFACYSIGGVRWVMFYPLTARTDRQRKIPTLFSFACADYDDPYWMMKVLAHDRALCDMAADDGGLMLFFLVPRGTEGRNFFVEIFQEASARYPIDNERMYLNLAPLYDAGLSLSRVPGYIYPNRDGTPCADPDAAVFPFGTLGIPAAEMTDRWAQLYSLNRKQILSDAFSGTGFDRARMIHSATAERMMPGIALEHDFDRCDDPRLFARYAAMGLDYGIHETAGERWFSMVPHALAERPEPLPLLFVLQETGSGNAHLALTAQSYCYECIRLAAQGEFIAIFFVLEDPADNDLLLTILEEAAALWPVDRHRIYLAGHSHNGMFTTEFARRHPRVPAGIITMGNHPGYMGVTGTAAGTDDTPEKLEAFRAEDVPTVVLGGTAEHNYYYPLAGELQGVRSENTVALRTGSDDRIAAWRRRLYAYNCPDRTPDQIRAALQSADYTERRLGFPCDRTELLYLDGCEHYIGDIKNNAGRFHLRIVGIDNVPHLPTPSMIDLAWSYIRRFARADDGSVTERC